MPKNEEDDDMENVASKSKDLESERFGWLYYGGSSNVRRWTIFILLTLVALMVNSVQYNMAKVGLVDYTIEESTLYVPPYITNIGFDLNGLSRSPCQDLETFRLKDLECKLHFVDTEFKNGDLLVSYAGKPSDGSTHVFTLIQSVAEKKHNLFFSAVPKGVFFSSGKAFVKWKYETRMLMCFGIGIASILLIVLLTWGLNSKLTSQQGDKKLN